MTVTTSCGNTRIILEDSSGFVLLEDSGYLLQEAEPEPASVCNPPIKRPKTGNHHCGYYTSGGIFSTLT